MLQGWKKMNETHKDIFITTRRSPMRRLEEAFDTPTDIREGRYYTKENN